MQRPCLPYTVLDTQHAFNRATADAVGWVQTDGDFTSFAEIAMQLISCVAEAAKVSLQAMNRVESDEAHDASVSTLDQWLASSIRQSSGQETLWGFVLRALPHSWVLASHMAKQLWNRVADQQ